MYLDISVAHETRILVRPLMSFLPKRVQCFSRNCPEQDRGWLFLCVSYAWKWGGGAENVSKLPFLNYGIAMCFCLLVPLSPRALPLLSCELISQLYAVGVLLSHGKRQAWELKPAFASAAHFPLPRSSAAHSPPPRSSSPRARPSQAAHVFTGVR